MKTRKLKKEELDLLIEIVGKYNNDLLAFCNSSLGLEPLDDSIRDALIDILAYEFSGEIDDNDEPNDLGIKIDDLIGFIAYNCGKDYFDKALNS